MSVIHPARFIGINKILVLLCISVLLVQCNGKPEDVDAFANGDKGEVGSVGSSSLEFNPGFLEFGNVSVNKSGGILKSVTLTNIAKQSAAIKSISIDTSSNAVSAGMFEIVSSTCPMTEDGLASRATCSFDVKFSPATSGLHESQVIIEFSAKNSQTVYQHKYDITGTGVAPLVFAGLNPVSASSISTTKATLTWPLVAGANSYVISQVVGANLVAISTLSNASSSFQVQNLNPNTTYEFQVNALNIVGEADANTVRRSFSTDAVGVFAAVPTLSFSEGSSAISIDVGSYCSDSETNYPQFLSINSISDSQANCTLLSSPFRLECNPSYKTGHVAWTSNINLSCLLNDYPSPLSRTVVVQVNDTNRAPTVGDISNRTVLAGVALAPITATSTDLDGDSVTYTCQYDMAVNGTITPGAAACSSLLNQSGANSTFTGGIFNWTPNLTYAGQVFEVGISADDGHGGVATEVFTITVSEPPPSASTSLVTVSSSAVTAGNTVTVTLVGKDSFGNNMTLGGANVIFSFSGGTSTGTLSSTTDLGNGSYTATFTGQTAGTATTISASIEGTVVTTTLPTIQVNPGAASPTTSQVTVLSSLISSGATTGVRVTVRDLYNNIVTSGTDTVTFTRSGGGSTGNFSAVSHLGSGVYGATFSGVLAGTATTIGATVNGATITGTMPTIQVIPGVVSVSQSRIELPSGVSSVAAGNIVNVTLTAKDAAGNQLNSGGLTIVIANAGGTATVSVGTVIDNTDGTYLIPITGVNVGAATTLSATINGVSLTSGNLSLEVTPGTVSLTQSTLVLGTSALVSGNTTTATLTAKDTYGNQLATGGLSVVFNKIGAGTSTVGFSSTVDGANGVYTSTLTGLVAGSAIQIGAQIGGASLASTLPNLTVGVGPINLSRSAVTLSSASVVAGSISTVTLSIRDINDNLITAAQTVGFSLSGGTSNGSFSPVTNNGNGTYSATFTASTSGTAVQVVGTINGTPLTSTFPSLTVIPGALSLAQSTVTVSSNSVLSGSAATVTVTARDALGNQFTTGGLTIVLSYSGGTSTGSFSAVVDSGSGTYSSTFTGITAGTATQIAATIGGSAITSASPSVTVNPGPVSLANSTLTVGASTVVSSYSTPLTLTVRDANNNQANSGGRTVVLSYTGGTSTGSISSVTDLANGTYTATFTGVNAGTATTLTASIDGSAITSALPTMTVTAPQVSGTLSELIVFPATVIADGVTQVPVKVKVKDGTGTALSGAILTMSSSRGGLDTIVGPTPSVTDSNGETYFYVASTTAGYAELTVSSPAVSVTLAQKARALFLSDNPTSDYRAVIAKNGQLPGENTTPVTNWKNIMSSLTTIDGLISGISTWSTSTGWSGDGTLVTGVGTGPYRLELGSGTINFGTSRNTYTSVSYELWVKPASFSATNMIGNSTNSWGSPYATNSNHMGMSIVGGKAPNVSIGSLNCSNSLPYLAAGAWSHVVATLDGSTRAMKLFVNGIQVCSYTYPTSTSSNYYGYPGTGTLTVPSTANAAFAEIRFYNKALSSTQITTNFNATRANYVSSVPTAPGSLASSIGATTLKPNLTWLASASDVYRYVVQQSTDNFATAPTTIANLGADTLTYEVPNLVGGTTYYFRTYAVNPVGDSSFSNTTSVTTPNCEMAWNRNVSRYNGGNYVLTWDNVVVYNNAASPTSGQYQIGDYSYTSCGYYDCTEYYAACKTY